MKEEVNVHKLIDRFNDMHSKGQIITPSCCSQKAMECYMNGLICQIIGTIAKEAEEEEKET